MIRKALCVGSAGFIGSHLAEELHNQGIEVFVIDDLSAGSRDNIPFIDDEHFIEYDISIPFTTKDVTRFKDIDVIFHNAAAKSSRCLDAPDRDWMVNASGSRFVFSLANQTGAKVIHASTGSVCNGKPKTFYGVSKNAAEGYLRAFKEYYPDFRYTILRYYHVYGPRQAINEKAGVVQLFIRNALRGKPLTIEGDGKQVRYFTHVKDVVSANLLAATDERTDGQTYDVANDRPVSIDELAGMVGYALGPVKTEFVPARPGENRTFTFSNPMQNAGWKPEWTFERGFQDTINWYKGQLSKA